MILNKWGCFPVTRPSTDWLEDNERMILTNPFPFIQPPRPDIQRPLRILIALPGLEFDGESKPFWYWPVGGGRYQGPGRLAAISHDEYCHRGRDNNDSPYPSPEVHRMYYEACRCAGLHALRAESRYAGVRTGGPRFGVGDVEGKPPAEYTEEHLRTLAPVAYSNLAMHIGGPVTMATLTAMFEQLDADKTDDVDTRRADAAR